MVVCTSPKSAWWASSVGEQTRRRQPAVAHDDQQVDQRAITGSSATSAMVCHRSLSWRSASAEPLSRSAGPAPASASSRRQSKRQSPGDRRRGCCCPGRRAGSPDFALPARPTTRCASSISCRSSRVSGRRRPAAVARRRRGDNLRTDAGSPPRRRARARRSRCGASRRSRRTACRTARGCRRWRRSPVRAPAQGAEASEPLAPMSAELPGAHLDVDHAQDRPAGDGVARPVSRTGTSFFCSFDVDWHPAGSRGSCA